MDAKTLILLHSRLKQILSYDPSTGFFSWKESRGSKSKGQKAGVVNDNGYVVIRIDGRLYAGHRLAWFYEFEEWPEEQIDHIDGSRKNNSLQNLRKASNKENSRNTGLKASNSSGYKGVSRCNRSGKWYASIKVNGKTKSLGLHSTPEAAYAAYVKEAELVFGEFARV